jgi:hypothetical protein
MRLEIDGFEIYWLQYAAVANYLRLAQSKLDHLHRKLSDDAYTQIVRTLARAELDNTGRAEAWLARHPDGLHNPCHSLLGKLMACWPDVYPVSPKELSFEPKRKSLERLVTFKIAPPLPLFERIKSVV